MYYDENGLPTLDNNKKFGVRHEYNEDDRESALINLDAAGNIMDNSNHYAMSKTTYTSDGKIVMYYDMNGNPAKLSYGQSGYIYKNGKSICVDQNGRKMLILQPLLYNSFWRISPAANRVAPKVRTGGSAITDRRLRRPVIFTSIVVNLATQAGVRYSIDHPDVYIESNLIGFYNILEACRHSYDNTGTDENNCQRQEKLTIKEEVNIA